MKHSSSHHQQLLTSFNTFKIDDNSVQNKQIKKNLLTVFILKFKFFKLQSREPVAMETDMIASDTYRL